MAKASGGFRLFAVCFLLISNKNKEIIDFAFLSALSPRNSLRPLTKGLQSVFKQINTVSRFQRVCPTQPVTNELKGLAAIRAAVFFLKIVYVV